jgi:hypothetical protein
VADLMNIKAFLGKTAKQREMELKRFDSNKPVAVVKEKKANKENRPAQEEV